MYDGKVPCENCICISICRARNFLSEIIRRCTLVKNYLNGGEDEEDKFFVVLTDDQKNSYQNIFVFPDSEEVLDRIKKVFFTLEVDGEFEEMTEHEERVFIKSKRDSL